jgi:hypothetical protein
MGGAIWRPFQVFINWPHSNSPAHLRLALSTIHTRQQQLATQQLGGHRVYDDKNGVS